MGQQSQPPLPRNVTSEWLKQDIARIQGELRSQARWVLGTIIATLAGIAAVYLLAAVFVLTSQ